MRLDDFYSVDTKRDVSLDIYWPNIHKFVSLFVSIHGESHYIDTFRRRTHIQALSASFVCDPRGENSSITRVMLTSDRIECLYHEMK